MIDKRFYKDKIVLVTGHTGFKGTWMCQVLYNQGANVIGYALEPEYEPNLFGLTNMSSKITSIIGDIRDLNKLTDVVKKFQPEIVIHMAAQPLVRESYINPVYTYETNVIGTVNILEAIRLCGCVKSFVNVTTDKVYKNNEWCWGYREEDSLNGHDPYSNSKSCSELVTDSYKNSFFFDKPIAISTCRAGNVIGGGDFAKDRIIPDCIRSIINGTNIKVRNPYSIRPYQHVLEPIAVYLMIASKQYGDSENYEGSYNVGPDDCDCVTTGYLTDLFCKYWEDGATWENIADKSAPHEANFLKLDCSKIKNKFNWQPRWNIEKAIKKTIEWSKVYVNNENMVTCMDKQIKDFFQ